MAAVKLRNINPLGQVDLPIAYRQGDPLGEHGSGCLEPGEIFEVPDSVAGRPPVLDRNGALILDDDGNPVDLGEGLLAQHTNYELADGAPAKKAAAKKTAAKKTAAPADPPPGELATTVSSEPTPEV